MIRTVLGDIPQTELGITLCHEHLLWNIPVEMENNDPDLGFDSIPAAVAELRYFKSAGGATLVEMSTAEIGRSPHELRQISVASQVHIIATTGHHKHVFSAASVSGKSKNVIATGMIKEICTGMDEGNIRAGVIKVASSSKITASEQIVMQGAGIAHRQTGAPVSTHTEAGAFAIEQAEILLEAGVSPDKLLIGHLDRGLPIEEYISLAKLGVYLGFDQIGKQKYLPDSDRVSLITSLVEAGYLRQILLSSDTARKSSWHVHNPLTDGMAYILHKFIPMLQMANLPAQAIHTILVENPARFLSFKD